MKESLKGILESIVEDLENEKEIDLEATPALFSWRYEDNPEINYQLLIKRGWEEDEEGKQVVH